MSGMDEIQWNIIKADNKKYWDKVKKSNKRPDQYK